MNIQNLRKKYGGLIGINTKVPLKDSYSLSLVYTPGVGESCKEIKNNIEVSFELTNRGNSLLVVIDVTEEEAYARLPFVESIAYAHKEFADIDAYPFVIKTQDVNELANILINLTPNFAAYDLRFISKKLKSKLLQKLESIEIPFLSQNIEFCSECKISNTLFASSVLKGAMLAGAKKLPEEMVNKIFQKYNFINFDQSAEIVAQVVELLNKEGLNRNEISPDQAKQQSLEFIYEGKKTLCPNYNFKTKDHTILENSLLLHRKLGGVIHTESKFKFKNPIEIKQIISPDENEKISKEILAKPELVFDYTSKANLVGVITEGSAVLGFGNIGAEAALPVMEGKAALFKSLAGVDAFPICLKTQNIDEFVSIVEKLTPVLGGINLEDIGAPMCFEIEQRLIEKTDIPIFHDDQHGTAIIVLAGFLNALKLIGKKIDQVKVVMSGAGAAAQAVAKLLLSQGVKNLILSDIEGAVYKGRDGMDKYLAQMAERTNPNDERGSLKDIIKGADFIIGLSAAGVVTPEMVKSMNQKPVVFALANPVPEIMPDLAKDAGGYIVATGRSDFKNQINNSLAFPGVFRGALDVKASRINEEMKLAAASAIASLIKEDELNPEYIIPHALDLRVVPAVASEVARAAIESGVANVEVDPDNIYEKTKSFIYGF